jgi:hypothetical protein
MSVALSASSKKKIAELIDIREIHYNWKSHNVHAYILGCLRVSRAKYVSHKSRCGNFSTRFMSSTDRQTADQSGCAVLGMKCLRSLERWDRGFES